jgi:hypothetical protein
MLRQTKQVTLADSAPGSAVVVTRVRDSSTEILKYVTLLGIVLNRRILVKEVVSFDGSLRVQIGARERFVSEKLARNIFVQPAAMGRHAAGKRVRA